MIRLRTVYLKTSDGRVALKLLDGTDTVIAVQTKDDLVVFPKVVELAPEKALDIIVKTIGQQHLKNAVKTTRPTLDLRYSEGVLKLTGDDGNTSTSLISGYIMEWVRTEVPCEKKKPTLLQRLFNRNK